MSVATKSAGNLKIAAERFPQNHRVDRRIQSMKEESEAIKKNDFKAYHWVVEKTHSWMNRFRRVPTCREKNVENDETMLHFACRISGHFLLTTTISDLAN
ncbi:TPA: transposase [Kluyvera ascorbata]|nr:transposase [Kluyvera ascorbata]